MNKRSLSSPAQETVSEQLDRLRDQGAHRYDPVRFQYLDSLARRLAASPGQQHSLTQALAQFQERFVGARAEASAQIDEHAGDLSETERDTLGRCLELGDIRAVHRLASRFRARQRPSPIADLTEQLLAYQPPADGNESLPPPAMPAPPSQPSAGTTRRELRALSQVRAVQAQLSIEKRIANAIAQTPANAGPMNAHRLVTRAVTTMQQISPEYLNRFVGYVDTLLAMEQMARKG